MLPSSDWPSGTLERPGALVCGNRLERLARSVAMRAGLGLAVHGLADFGRVGRMDDLAVLAEDSDAVDALLVGHVVDDAVDIGGLVLQHGEAGAFGDHFGELDDVIGHLAENFAVEEPGDQPGEQKHGHRQRDCQVEHDLQLQGSRLHGCRRLPRGADGTLSAAISRRQNGCRAPPARNPPISKAG